MPVYLKKKPALTCPDIKQPALFYIILEKERNIFKAFNTLSLITRPSQGTFLQGSGKSHEIFSCCYKIFDLFIPFFSIAVSIYKTSLEGIHP